MTLTLRRPNQARERLLGECLDEEACEVLWEDEHNKGAVVLSKAINDFKGFYVKVLGLGLGLGSRSSVRVRAR